jgi:hypothetical protein
MGSTAVERHLETIAHNSDGKHPAIAFFDLDGTLIAGYSILALAVETAKKGAGKGQLQQSVRLVKDVLRHKARRSGGNYHRLVRRLTHALRSTPRRRTPPGDGHSGHPLPGRTHCASTGNRRDLLY